MIAIHRSPENPILVGESHNLWEAEAAFNGCPIKNGKRIDMVYRALSTSRLHHGAVMEVSSIGHATSDDGVHFEKHRQLIEPELEWERFGCEDPRITKVGDKFYIFYTALGNYPFSAEGIHVGLAITKDLKTIDEKHLITPFNAKAMALFPEKIDGKWVAILTADTDRPPSRVGIAFFEKEEDMWSKEYWEKWYASLSEHTLPLQREENHHVEVGAPPIKTKKGWLLVYSSIQNYFSQRKIFGVEAVLLDLKDPRKIIGRTRFSLMTPEEEYERYGKIPNIIFPSGALRKNKTLHIYYGAADSTCCVASCDMEGLLGMMLDTNTPITFERYEKNPILEPLPEHAWEAKAVFNPAVVQVDGRVHMLYRAMSHDDVSVMGYASSKDGFVFDERLPEPAYVPREPFELKARPGNSGCEDPRLTQIGEDIYMMYTAVDAANPPRVALTSIKVSDFVAKRWSNWTKPKLISPPGIDDKDACVLPEKIKGKYVVFHRIQPSIDINFFEDLNFENGQMLTQRPMLLPRPGMWDDKKIGINSVPTKTESGWLMLYHGVSQEGSIYRLGAALLDLKDPEKVIGRTDEPLFEPQMDYERVGVVPNVVFPCGALTLDSKLVIYYGGADRVIGIASLRLEDILKRLKRG
jgi:predicted GH43/DUF377 family glycosyl hydrolase